MKIKIFVLILFMVTASFYISSFSTFNNYYNLSVNNLTIGNKINIQANITMEEAQKKIEERFKNYNITQIEYLGESINRNIEYYKFRMKLGEYREFCIEVSKEGGFIFLINCLEKSLTSRAENEECLEKVKDYIEELGFSNFEVTWHTQIEDEIIINLAPIKNNVILYPDLIKAKANCKTGKILNLETRGYLYDSSEKNDEFFIPSISSDEITKKIDDKYKIISSRLAAINLPEKGDTLVYEIKAKLGEYTYYFYIDAQTGEQIEALPVIE